MLWMMPWFEIKSKPSKETNLKTNKQEIVTNLLLITGIAITDNVFQSKHM